MVIRSILFTISLLLSNVHGKNETMQKIELKGVDPLAVCNDGSSAAYVWKKSPTGSNKWLIMLGGGGSCWDDPTCKDRTSSQEPPLYHFTSSVNQPQEYDKLTGIFSPDKDESPMWDANKAFLHHCTSDFFMGGLGGPDKAEKKYDFYFRGQNHVNAMVKHLLHDQGFIQAAQKEKQIVVFGGTSSGAVAASYHLDNFANALKPYNAQVLGLLDSGMFFDMPSLHENNGTSMRDSIKFGFQNLNGSALLPQDCAKEFSQNDQWKCMVPEFRYKYIKTPFVLIQDQYDDYYLSRQMGFWPRVEFDKDASNYAMNYGNQTRNYFKNFDLKNVHALLYSPACGYHAVSTYPAFATNQLVKRPLTQKMLLQEALDDIAKGKQLNKKYIDTCDGLRCNHLCAQSY